MDVESAKISLIPEQQQKSFSESLKRLLGINAIGFGLSATNELIAHSALGFTQMTMEAVDSFMAVGLEFSHRNDVAGRHRRASLQRQGLYGVHIIVAGVGIAESFRLLDEGSEPTPANIAISGIVAVLNMHYLRHRRKHHKQIAHKTSPTYLTAFEDPLEVVQDELHNTPSPEVMHKLNEDGTTAIAKTNIVESIGGLAGAASYFVIEQGPSVAAIASSAGVIGIMAMQIVRDRDVLKSAHLSK
jgi:hypothetical protein